MTITDAQRQAADNELAEHAMELHRSDEFVQLLDFLLSPDSVVGNLIRAQALRDAAERLRMRADELAGT